MSSLGFGELVHIARLSYGEIPAEFTWRGRRHVVRVVEDLRLERSDAHRSRSPRRLLRLRTSSGMRCLLSEDRNRGVWKLERVLGGQGG